MTSVFSEMIMKWFLVLAFLAFGANTSFSASSSPEVPSEDEEIGSSRPNVLLVVADDLGMFDIGAFGSEIRTPSIDGLANQGLMFTGFHTSATCSPTRAMLLSGTDAHAAGLGNMAEHTAPNQREQRGYEGHLSDRVVTVAKLLQDDGYDTFMAGKWHLGRSEDLLPVNRGFDESFALLEGGASYFSDMMGILGVARVANYRRNTEVVTKLPDDFYASEYYADFIIDQLDQSRSSDSPFFAYLAFSAPHWPLQVKDEHIDLYRGAYDQGYEYLLERRLAAALEKDIFPQTTVPANWPSHVVPWDELTPEQQKTQSRVMEVYAAVVERMDFHLGRVLSYLEQQGELENTLIVFMSDNGPDGSDRSKLPGNDVWLPEAWDLSYENMGKIGSYVYPGAAWARTSAGPMSMYKEFLSEGGITAPLIISHPKAADGTRPISEFTSVKDITPTILDFVGIEHPGTEYQGREISPIEGRSLASYLDGEAIPGSDGYVMGWELFGQRAIRKGDWKLLWLSSKPKWLVQPENADQWRLYNLAVDPGETNNLVAAEPEKYSEMMALWKEYVKEQSVILPDWGN